MTITAPGPRSPVNAAAPSVPAALAAVAEQLNRLTRLPSLDQHVPRQFDFLHGTPGEAAVLLMDGWWVHGEAEATIPTQYRGGPDWLRWSSVILTDGTAYLVFRIETDCLEADKTRRSWGLLTAIQRFNALLTALTQPVLGIGLDGLLAELAGTVEDRRYGSDPTNWVAAARLILNDDHPAQVRAALDSTLFLAALSAPTFVSLLAAKNN